MCNNNIVGGLVTDNIHPIGSTRCTVDSHSSLLGSHRHPHYKKPYKNRIDIHGESLIFGTFEESKVSQEV